MKRKIFFFTKPTGLMDRDVASGFVRAGFDLHTEDLHFGKTPEGHTVQLFSSRQILDRLDRLKPDIIFSLNGHGSDSEGFLAGEYARRGIPFATWFVDMPKRTNLGPGFPASNSHLFVFDSSDVSFLKELGFDRVSFLPLATNPDRFRKIAGIPVEKNACFVGASDYDTIQYLTKNLDRLNQGHSDRFLDAVEAAIDIQLKCRDLPTTLLVENAFRAYGIPRMSSMLGQDLIEAFVEREASLRLRLTVIERLGREMDLVVYGDKLWAKVVGKNCRGRIPYGTDAIVETYNRHAVHINVSKFQLRKAVNQRPFDVSACGAFLITDERESLRQLFEEDEIVSYRTIDELIDKARYFLKHDETRTEMVQKARRRVLTHHTYAHRANQILQTVYS